MPIRVECESCRQVFRVKDEAAGRRGKCPRCQNPLIVPHAAAASGPGIQLDDDEDGGTYAVEKKAGHARAAPSRPGGRPVLLTSADAITAPTRTPAQILQAFRDYIESVRPTPLYRFTVLMVACAMLVLPLIYLGLILLVGWGMFYHATHSYVIFQNLGHGRDARGAIFVYFGPLAAGAALIAFLVKPIYARPGKSEKVRTLDPSVEPLLFAFVDGVCSTVGAPSPSRIEVDCNVNAGAMFEGGALGIRERRLVLRIGLPLVAGLDIRQFAGVLAHEFGHFSQGGGMRVSRLIRSISFWLTRVVYERDQFDEMLVQLCKSGNGGLIVVGVLTRGVVWLTRRVLWCLMMAGHAISGILMRQMEFDADRYEARMVGGEVFEATCRRLPVLNMAMQGAFVDLQQSWRENRLADNIPKLVLANVDQIPRELLEKIDEQTAEARTKLLDTHPCDRERIFHAHAEDAEGVFTLDGPASDVFRDFDSLCRAATFDFYKATFGPLSVDKGNLRPVSEVVRSQEASADGAKALDRVSQGLFNLLRPLKLPEVAPSVPADLTVTRKHLIAARDRMAETADDYADALKEADEARTRAIKIDAATYMHQSGFNFKPSEFGLRKSGEDHANEARREAARELGRLDEAMSVRESATIRRLHAALSLLEHDAVAARVEDADACREEARMLYPVARHVGHNGVPAMVAMFRAQQSLLGVLSKFEGNEQSHQLRKAILRGGRQLREALQELHAKLGNSIGYPFEHHNELITLSQYAVPRVPNDDDIGELLNAAGESLDKLGNLHHRLAGRLALIAETVETALGMKSLPERKSEEDEETA